MIRKIFTLRYFETYLQYNVFYDNNNKEEKHKANERRSAFITRGRRIILAKNNINQILRRITKCSSDSME